MVAQSEPSPDAGARTTGHDRLPRYAQPLVGRGRETNELQALFLRTDEARPVSIVTLVGSGGVGKTRLAVRIATILLDHLADGAVFVPLASIDDPDLVPLAIADALGAGGFPPVAGDAEHRVRATLEHRAILIVLDNVEQIPGFADRLSTLSEQLPNVLWLVTSRSPLHLAHEIVYPVAPLPIPDVDEPAAASPSIQLFASQARQANAAFEVTAANLPAVRTICRRLGGLPLAIELAAARIRSFGPEEMTHILDRATGALDLLEDGSAEREERHSSIREALAWSSSLLAPSA
ncbi:MAG TPA: AAA family ATPase, partial [Thermomicrobiales bacterium]|nr:AAA family ATPase [Thermomicrobiales bacterium]